MKIKVGIAIASLVFFVNILNAQIDGCGTDLMNQKFAADHPERVSYREQIISLINSASIEQGTERNTLVIPLVVHVLHKGGPENISNEQIFDAIRVLNEDLRRINSDTSNTRPIFKPYGADFNVEFRLAKIDPNGNCTNGITKTYSLLTNSANDDVKSDATGGITAWPVNKYFNIWVVGGIKIDQSNVIGYAYFPSWGMSGDYGVVIDNNYFGTIGTSQGQDGRTLTHEVGHCLELYHTFQSGCGGNCSFSGDNVCDTPPVTAASFPCNFSYNTCSNDASGPSAYNTDVPDMIENYMSYNQGFCQNLFTKGQKQRSDAAFQNTFIGQLVTSQNLSATGTSNGFTNACVLDPDFRWSKSVICAGDSIVFTDLTQNGIADTYQWNFMGASNFNVTGNAPTVIFTQPGIYSVNLTVTNGAGQQSILKQQIIRVSDASVSNTMFFDEFNNNPIVGGRWTTKNSEYALGWAEKVLPNGNNTVYVHNFVNNGGNILHELYSPIYDISNIISPKVYFKVASALKSGNSSDRLKMYFSKDCGKTWILRFSRTGVNLATTLANTQEMQPLSANDWLSWESMVPETMLGVTNFMVKFTFETGGGNNLYLDDINIQGLASIDESIQAGSLPLFPNPTSDNFTLDVSSLSGKLQLNIYDMSGRMISSSNINGGNIVPLSTQSLGLAAGMYRITVKGKTSLISAKIIVTE